MKKENKRLLSGSWVDADTYLAASTMRRDRSWGRIIGEALELWLAREEEITGISVRKAPHGGGAAKPAEPVENDFC